MSRNVPVSGAELFYSRRGSGIACLVLSAIGTKPYERMMPPQLGDFIELVFVDLRGGGRSSGNPTELTFDLLADDLESIRADLGVGQVVVLGHSILGALAIEYGRRRPSTVLGVIAVGTPPRGDMTWLAGQATAFFERDASDDRKQTLRANLSVLAADAPIDRVVLAQTPIRFFEAHQDVTSLFAEADVKPSLLGHVMGELTRGWDITTDRRSLDVPLLLLHGRYDYTVPYTLWTGVLEKLPNASLRLFERSGHHPFFEEPEAFTATVADWIKSSPRGRRANKTEKTIFP
ncbi:MAG TPA: alpha/beta hydrolase [Candidatus Acidoferrales bacterium]|nr:alpha/beta hydrolase [Candidatus Acidoferrales bacterium]